MVESLKAAIADEVVPPPEAGRTYFDGKDEYEAAKMLKTRGFAEVVDESPDFVKVFAADAGLCGHSSGRDRRRTRRRAPDASRTVSPP